MAVAAPHPAPPALAGRIDRRRLGNGLEVVLVENRQAPIVSTALFYRAGARDEPRGQGGVAHFLEHMMFKGSGHYATGDIDRLTQQLGGSSNAFTSHDVTVYYFSFAADHWRQALAIEADRMRGLLLDPAEVASERSVIVEEIGMYEDEPWDALEMAVLAALFPTHPYGRPVLGSRAELAASGREELARFHAEHYAPGRAVLVVAGDLPPDAEGRIADVFGDIPSRGRARADLAAPEALAAPRRLTRHQGEAARLLLALPAPGAGEAEHASLRLLVALLGSGRARRLQRRLVDELQLCLGVSVQLAEQVSGGFLTLAAETMPGVEPQRVEAALLAELAALRSVPVGADELARARQVLLADWVFGHERIHQQALTAAVAAALFDLELPARSLAHALELDAVGLAELAERFLDPERGAVLGWSLP